MHLIDTNICVAILRGASPRVSPKFRAAMSAGVGVSSITAAELYFGVAKCTRSEQNRRNVENLLSSVTVVPFDSRAAEAFGVLRDYLWRRGQVIGPYDLLIAAQAIVENAILVTNNTREFSRVPTLVLEDWL